MIISLYERNKPGVRGTINTNGDTPSATGIGEPMLETWLKAHEGEPVKDITRSLEAFYSAWGNQALYSAVEPDGADATLKIIEADGNISLINNVFGALEVRDDKEWRPAASGDKLTGVVINVSEEAVAAFDAGKIKSLDDAKAFGE